MRILFRTFLTSILGFALYFSGHTQCESAIPLSSLPESFSGTTCDGRFIAQFCANIYTLGYQSIYSYTPTETEVVSMELFSSGDNSELRPSLSITTDCFSCEKTSSPPISTVDGYSTDIPFVTLKAGVTYYIIISSDRVPGDPGTAEIPPTPSKECIDFEIEIATLSTSPGEGPSTACSDTVVTEVPFEMNVANCAGGDRLQANQYCGGSAAAGMDYIIEYTPDETHCVNIELGGMSGYMSLMVFRNCPKQGSGCFLSEIVSVGDVKFLNLTLEEDVTYYFWLGSEDCNRARFKITDSQTTEVGCTTYDTIPDVFSTFVYPDYRCKVNEARHIINTGGCNQVLNRADIFIPYVIRSDGNECIEVQSSGIQEAVLLNGCPFDGNATCVAAGLFGDFSVKLTNPGIYYLLVGTDYIYADRDYYVEINRKVSTGTGLTCSSPEPLGEGPFVKTVETELCQNDRYFSFTVPKDGCYDVSAHFSSGGIGLLDANCRPLNALQVSGGSNGFFRYNLTAGTTYKLRVTSSSLWKPELTIEISESDKRPDPCIECTEKICKACENASFEKSTFEGWELFEGPYSNPFTRSISDEKSINQGSNSFVQLAHSSAAIDFYSEESVKNPFGGDYVVKLGNHSPNAKGYGLRYTFQVDSNSNVFSYFYSVVLEDPQHVEEDQPFFKISVFAENGEEIECGAYEVYANGDVPGFLPSLQGEDIYYKPWSAVAIPLNDYFGQEVTIQFQVKDCARGDHFGYAYLDAGCSSIFNDNVTAICGNTPALLNVPPGFESHVWSTGATTEQISVTEEGEYSVTVQTVTGCELTYNYTVVKEDAPNMDVDFQTFGCDTTEVHLFATAPDGNFPSYGWELHDYSFVHSDTVVADPGSDGVYEYTYLVNGQHCVFDTTFEVSVHQTPTNQPLTDTTICEETNLMVEIELTSPNEVVKWFDNKSILRRGFNSSGEYFYEISSGSCVFYDTLSLSVFPKPDVNINNVSYCDSTHVEISCNDRPSEFGYSGFTIENGPYLPGDYVRYDFGQDGNYNLIYTIGDGTCVFEYDISVSVAHTPDVLDFGNDTLCEGENIPYYIATSGPYQTIHWEDTGSQNPRTIGETGMYPVEVRSGNCVERDTVRLFAVTNPIDIDILVDCDSSEITLQAEAIPDYFSSAGWTAEDFGYLSGLVHTLKYEERRPYGFTFSVDNGSCFFSVTDTVGIGEKPELANFIADTVCGSQDSAVFLFQPANSVTTITWESGGEVMENVIYTPGVYNYVISNGECAVRDSIEVFGFSLPQTILGEDTSICETGSLVLSVPRYAGATYNWNTNPSSHDTSITISLAGNYILEVENNGCVGRDEINVFVDTVPHFSVSDTLYGCEGNMVSVETSSSRSVFWSNQPERVTSYVTSEEGFVMVSDTNGLCHYTDSVWVELQRRESIYLIDSVEFCAETSVRVEVTYSATEPSLIWSNGQESPSIQITQPGNYWVYLSYGECLDSAQVRADTIAIPRLKLDPFYEICQGDSVWIAPGHYPEAEYSWSFEHENNMGYLAKEEMEFWVMASLKGCRDSAFTEVITYERPVFELGASTQSFCLNETKEIGIEPIINTIVRWNTGEVTPKIEVEEEGVYTLTVKRGACNIKDSVAVTFLEIPKWPITPDSLCPYDSAQIKVKCETCFILWEDGTAEDVKTVYANQDYHLQLQHFNGCVVENDIEVKELANCLDLYVPNAFSPDGDTKNEVFFPVGHKVVIQRLTIFNRLGSIVFQTHSSPFEWDGLIEGALGKNDVYIWEVRYVDYYGNAGVKRGHVTLWN